MPSIGRWSKLELQQLTAEDFDRTFKINFYAYFHLLMTALLHFQPGDAVIATATEEALKAARRGSITWRPRQR
ncbi:NAD(P)-dependent dehydrogenase (short-subunit alcohol dehydrogenase family) [Streptomyces canus]|uniref:hypothetical protein n=1 Tax=Streptomyces canus TaxID=58343 RepID=UPI00277D6E71|nr:hypothetical protein [Streptomyces canus]MDQ0604635.1 NAD(P)-dependent dehydrogenase (short-subunit alcohol dehydrogenase family) [Streptomyces canus]